MRYVTYLLAVLIVATCLAEGANGERNPIPVNDSLLEQPLGVDHTSSRSCDWYDYTCNISNVWTIPNDEGSNFFNMRFSPPEEGAICTLKTLEMVFYEDSTVDNTGAGVILYIWDDDGFGFPMAVLHSVALPSASVPFYPNALDVDVSDAELIFSGDYHFGYSTADEANDVWACLSDDGSCGQMRSSGQFSGAWSNMVDEWGVDVNLLMFVEACCGCGPQSDCEWLAYNCGSSYYWTIPDSTGRTFLSMRFTPAIPNWTSCVVDAVELAFYNDYPEFANASGVDVCVWDDIGGFPGTLVETEFVAAAAMVYFPSTQVLPLTNPVAVTGDYHVGYTAVDQFNDNIACLSDDGSCGTMRSSEFWGGAWSLMLDDWGIDVNFLIYAHHCCGYPVTPVVLFVPSAYPTIQEAINASTAGDTVLVGPGTYPEALQFPSHRLTIMSSHGATETTLEPPPTSSAILVQHSSWSVLQGFTVSDAVCEDHVLHLERYADHFALREMRFIQCSAPKCIMVTGAAPVIERSLFVNASDLATISTYSAEAVIRNNTLVGGNGNGINAAGMYSFVQNNVVISFAGDAIAADSSCSVDYNDCWANGASTGQGTHGFSADPLFIDPDTYDFGLAEGSPCFDAGNPAADYNDADNTRSDIGAYYRHCGYPVVGKVSIPSEVESHVADHDPAIEWLYSDTSSSTQVSYEIEVGTDETWDVAEMWQPGLVSGGDAAVVYAGEPLADGVSYYVRLRLANAQGWGGWYNNYTFHMNAVPTIPALRSPEQEALISAESAYLVTNNSNDVEGDALAYVFEISTDSFTTVSYALAQAEGGDDSTVLMVPVYLLAEDSALWWRVKATDYYEESDYSEVWKFWVDRENSAPTTFQLYEPPDTSGTPLTTLTPEFVWDSSADSDPLDSILYTLYVAVDSNFTFQTQIPDIPASPYIYADSLSWGTKYWWKVKAEDTKGAATWSGNILSFRTVTLGDASGDGVVNVTDVVFLVAYIFGGGEEPVPYMAGDADCNGIVNVSDAVYLITYIFGGGPAPCEV